MSLINDALKRARQSQHNDPPPGATPLAPVESPARGGSGWMLGLAAILFLAAAGLFIGVAVLKRPAPAVETARAPRISPPPVRTASPAVAVSAPVSAPTRVPAAPPVGASQRTPAPVSASNLPSAAPRANPPSAAPVEPLPRVQGILYSPAHPVVIVNGKTVGVGDHIGHFRVEQILQDRIVLEQPDGSRTTLKPGK